jgi:ribosomal protein S18 acetylase RimI-like enzyme
MMLEINEITKSDALDLIQLWRTTWTATYGPSLGSAVLAKMLVDLDEKGTTSMLPENGERGYCVRSDGCLLGSVIVAERGGIAYLWGLYVLPDHQRRGLGSLLLAKTAGDLKEAKALEIRVLQTSAAALAFYRKHGFIEVGRETSELLGEVSTEMIVLSTDAATLNSTLQRG